jgi:hypothetical protein
MRQREPCGDAETDAHREPERELVALCVRKALQPLPDTRGEASL